MADFQQDPRSSGDNAQTSLSSVKQGAQKSIGVAKKAAKVVKGGKKGLKVSATSTLAAFKRKVKVYGSIFGVLFLIAAITTLPSLLLNGVMHINDAETLSAAGDIDYYGGEEQDLILIESAAEDAKVVVTSVMATAQTNAYNSLVRHAGAMGWTLEGDGSQGLVLPTDEAMVLIYAAYSASVHNMVSEESEAFYTETSAVADLENKIKALATQGSSAYPFGNKIHGADFMRDTDGNVLVTTEEVPAPVDEDTGEAGEPTYIYYVTPIIHSVELDSLAQEAFGVDMNAPYDEEGDPSGQRYSDIVMSMSYSIGTILFGEEFFDGSNIYWAGAIGVPNDNIVNTARSQLGNIGGAPYWRWYGFETKQAWCACFVSWCANQCGYIDAGILPRFSWCMDGINWFKQRNLWQPRNSGYTPKAGDIIFFDWTPGVGKPVDHVGIVAGEANGIVYTIEGNTNTSKIPSGQAAEKKYSRHSANILGYGTPLYPSEEQAGGGYHEKNVGWRAQICLHYRSARHSSRRWLAHMAGQV